MPASVKATAKAFSYIFSWRPCPTSLSTSKAQPRIFAVSSLSKRFTFSACVRSGCLSVSIRVHRWLTSLFHQRVLQTVHERLQAGFDDVVVHADSAPFRFAIGGFDQLP